MTIEEHTTVDVTIWARNGEEIEINDVGDNGTVVLRFGRFGKSDATVFFPGRNAFDTICALHAKLTGWIVKHAPPRSVAANLKPAIEPTDPEPPSAA